MQFAIIEKASGAVVNVVEWEGDTETWQPPEGCDAQRSDVARIGDTWDGDTFVPPPAPELEPGDLDAQARARRDELLSASDWSQLADVPTATQALWVPYRQALRDVPQQKGFPKKVKWPEAPQ